MVGKTLVTLSSSLKGFLSGILLVQRAAGDNSLWRTAVVYNPNQCPALHLVGKFFTDQCQMSVYHSHFTSRHITLTEPYTRHTFHILFCRIKP